MTTFSAPVWGPTSQCGLVRWFLCATVGTRALAIENRNAKPRAYECRVSEWPLPGVSADEGLELFLDLDHIQRAGLFFATWIQRTDGPGGLCSA